MRFSYTRFAIITLVGALALPAGAALALTNPVLDLGDGYATEGSRAPGVRTSVAGDTLTIVGHVIQFNDPLQDLDANDPNVEYTYILSGLASGGSTSDALYYNTNYGGGFFQVYCDSSLNADTADRSTFTDGTLILEGTFSGFVAKLRISPSSCAGSINSDLQFTGGTLFSRLSQSGVGFAGLLTGAYTACTSEVPTAQQNQGYFGLAKPKIDVTPPTPTVPTTWGHLKNSYE